MDKAIQDFIIKLKEVKDTSGYSYEQIVQGVQDNGETVSISTVRKIFADGSEMTGTFKWKTLQPVGRFLLGLDQSELYNPMNAKLYYEQLEAAKSDIDYREKEKHLLEEIIAEEKETVAGLRRQIKYQRNVSTALIICLILIIATVLIVDLASPDIGFFFLR